jgi:hypothetical protein
MPLFLLGLALVGGFLWWQSSHRYPEVPPTADALTLLNFPAYPLLSNKTTYSYFMGPEGLTAAQIIKATSGKEAALARKHIVLPGASIVPAFADLWAVETFYVGPAHTVTPQALLEAAGVPATVAQVEPARQLAALLYASTFNPTQDKLLLIPIAGKQA